jgi:hypothetical protein
MPNCDFYATPKDHAEILTWLFSEGTCRVYELSSEFEMPLREFRSAAEVLERFADVLPGGSKRTVVYLQLYVLGASPPFVPRRVTLDPKACGGATFRYAAEGWGLVQLYLASLTSHGLDSSHTNHNSEKRAQAWEPASISAWDFKRISGFSSRLNREIRKRRIAKVGSRVILPGALEIWNSGLPLVPYNPKEYAIEIARNG